MQIKRFEAKDMKTALRLIKKELGSDAVILSARSLKKENKIIGRVTTLGVEVTAAVDGSHHPAELKPVLNASALNSYNRNAASGLGMLPKRNFRQSVGSRKKTLYGRKQPLQPADTTRSGKEDLLADVFQHLLSQEVKRDIANDIIDALKAAYPGGGRFDTTEQVISRISNILKQRRNGAETQHRKKSGCQVVAVVGPTGVGKTTTVAKLAARHAIEHNKNVAIISLDSDRVGASEDLKVYAKAIGVPIKAAATPSAFNAAVNEFRQFDTVLVDTSGFNPKKQEQIDDLKACLNMIDGIETHLALSTMTKEGDLLNTLRCLNTLDVQYLIFTKLDESCSYGNLVNVLVQNPVPLSFVTNGREITHTIETGSMDKIVAYLLGNFKNRKALLNSEQSDQAPAELADRFDGRIFVANKNSDVFHRADCKWTQKIQSKNMITFSSLQTAKLQHFMPCQDCQPARSKRFQTGLTTRDNVRVSNYS
jgi:flagellar biosynthesis protein FlhF